MFLALVCTESVVRIDLVTESPNHTIRGDGRAAIPFSQSVDLAAQVDKPA
jgi:hypothetical protein